MNKNVVFFKNFFSPKTWFFFEVVVSFIRLIFFLRKVFLFKRRFSSKSGVRLVQKIELSF